MLRKYVHYLAIAWLLLIAWLGILLLSIVLWMKGIWYYYFLIPILIFMTPDYFGLFISYERFKREEEREGKENNHKD